jgi:SOS response regulatory protein OraA/RecX
MSATARAPVVTATREGRGRLVVVHLNGRPWRSLPVGAVAAAGLSVGVSLDRERARDLNRAIRRQRALDAAERILRVSDQTTATLAARLDRRGVCKSDGAETVQKLVSAGIVDDARFAHGRAAALARKELGDEGIRADLEARGISVDLVHEALSTLEPEAARAAPIFERGGVSRQTLARLARRGFCEATLEPYLGRLQSNEPGA